jgi:SMODS and SLOG-associating 2TM effector domain 1
MSERNKELLRFYEANRINDQMTFYSSRRAQFDRATGQGLALSAVLLGFATAAGALAGTATGWAVGWSAVATILPALSTALAAYVALYAFEQQSKVYGDAARALLAASWRRPDPEADHDGQTAEQNVAEFVLRVEGVFRQEQGQWGQLTSQIQVTGQSRG